MLVDEEPEHDVEFCLADGWVLLAQKIEEGPLGDSGGEARCGLYRTARATGSALWTTAALQHTTSGWPNSSQY